MTRPTRTTVRPAARALLLGAALVAAASCSSGPDPAPRTLPPGTSGGSTTASTSHGVGTIEREPTGTATITSFDLDTQLTCPGAAGTTTPVRYATEGAASVAFLVDGEQVPGSPPLSGTFDLPIGCDSRSHTVVLVAVDPEGGTVLDSRVVYALGPASPG